MKIGNIKIAGNLVLAPMYLVTDLPFRLLCKKHGASLTYTGLVSSKAVVMLNEKSFKLARTVDEEGVVAVQIFGDDPKIMAQAAKLLEGKGAPIIDLNFGCPAKDIVEVGAGASLLKSPKKIESIIKAVVAAVKVPVTAKIRIGLKESKKNIENSVKLAKMIEKAGACAIAVHGRTLEQGYSGKADWTAIKEIKKAVSIPIIGNGDVKSGEDALRMLDETGCDAVMIGRAAIGNPFLFDEIGQFLKRGIKRKHSAAERIEAYLNYLKLAQKYDSLTITSAKTHAGWFTKGIEGSARIRDRLSQCKTIAEMKEVLELVEMKKEIKNI